MVDGKTFLSKFERIIAEGQKAIERSKARQQDINRRAFEIKSESKRSQKRFEKKIAQHESESKKSQKRFEVRQDERDRQKKEIHQLRVDLLKQKLAGGQAGPEPDEQAQSALTRPELGPYVWRKAEDMNWLTVFEGKELRWPVDYKPLADIQKLLKHQKNEFDAYGLSDESDGPGSVDIGALLEEGLSISAGPMSSGGQKMTTPKARLLIKKTIQELKEERETTNDFCRKIEIDELLVSLDKARKEIRNQFPDVAKGIKAIKTGINRLISKIEPDHPKLAEHLKASIKRRNNCLVYEPTRKNIAWVTRNPT